jgi:hypothetical protein
VTRPLPNPGKAAWDYGLPQHAVDIAAQALNEGLGGCHTLANDSHLVIPNIAASIIYDLITTGAMTPAIPDVPAPARVGEQP